MFCSFKVYENKYQEIETLLKKYDFKRGKLASEFISQDGKLTAIINKNLDIYVSQKNETPNKIQKLTDLEKWLQTQQN